VSDFDLTDKVAIVTGAGGGIGREITLEFARAGAAVVLAGRSRDSLDSVTDELGDARSLIVPTDITNPDEVEKLVAATVDEFASVDIIVNNAGAGVMPCKAEETSYDDWVSMIDINLTATFNCCMATGKRMIKQKSGKIINVSSTAGTKGHPGLLHYSAAKAGVISLTNNLAYNWAEHNICVNVVLPGLIATPAMIKYGVIPPAEDEDGNAVPRLSLPPGPEDVAKMCRFLASPASDMITGEAIPVRAFNLMDRFWN
jgi:NAD(P)-dependent dehydrogenase (short-subunit alcohol dehydrogenase family)